MLSSTAGHLQFWNNDGGIKKIAIPINLSKMYRSLDVSNIIMSFDKGALSLVGYHIDSRCEIFSLLERRKKEGE